MGAGNRAVRFVQASSVSTMPSEPLVGWNAQLDIPTALSYLSTEQVADYVVLISLIDSTPQVANLTSVVSAFTGHALTCERVGDDLAVDASSFLRIANQQELLFGYDEVWLFAATPHLGKPTGFNITSDTRDEPMAAELIDWMKTSGCLAGLGDGEGLRYVTFDETITELWQSRSQRNRSTQRIDE
jgi:hypothetical protein